MVHEEIAKQAAEAPLANQFNGADSDEFDAWKGSFRIKLNDLLGDTTPPQDWQAEEVGREEFDDHVRLTLRLTAEGVASVPVYLLLPLKNDGPRPAVICVHGHGQFGHHPIVGRTDLEGVSKSIETCNYDYGLEFVRRGYVVAAPCLIPFGDRVDRESYSSDPCAVTFVMMQALGKLPIAENLRDLRWCLDLLQSRPEVDARRLGCAGLSYGGRMTMLTAAVDERVKVAALSGCLNLLQERSSQPYSCGVQIIPGLLNIGDFSEIGSLIAPRPCVWEIGSTDGLIVPGWCDVFRERLEWAYAAANAPGNLMFDAFEGGHQWNGDVAYPLFDEVLRPN